MRIHVVTKFSFVTLSLLLIIGAGCKTPHAVSNVAEADSSALPTEPADHGVTFAQFDYETDAMVLRELGSRIGCDEAQRWFSIPASGSMHQSIQNVMTSDQVYRTLVKEFFDKNRVRQACLEGGAPPQKSNIDGLKQLMAYVQKKYPGEGLTVIMHGGFGSHIGPVRSLDESNREWGHLIETQPTPILRVWQIECSNSFAPEDRCAKEFIDEVAQKEKSEPTIIKHHYLIWGFSKGGNTAVEALRLSQEMRDKTIALVTMGSPLGGSMTMLMLDPVVQKLATAVNNLTGTAAEFASRLPLQYLLTPAAYFINPNSQPVQVAQLLTPTEMPQAAAGSKAMLPAARKEYLYNTVKTSNFSRTDGSSIPVYHGVALADLAQFKSVPLLTLKDGSLAFKEKSFISDQVAELGFGYMMKDFPLSDTCVALQHAVFPRDAIPQGLSPELLAVMTFDHGSFRFTPLEGVVWDVPSVPLVDSILATVATRLERSAQ